MPLSFMDWEDRPALLSITPKGLAAWSVLAHGEDWTKVDAGEVIESGREVSEATFEERFPSLPPAPPVIAARHSAES